MIDTSTLTAVAQRAAASAAQRLGRESYVVRRLRPLYERGLGLVAGDRGVPWRVNGELVRIRPDQRHRFGPDHDAPVARLLKERLRPGALCLNVGANVGVYVLQLARWTVHGRVVAFEPNLAAVSILSEHVRMNGLEDRVQVVAAAVGSRAGIAVLHAAGADGMSRLDAPNPLLSGATTPVPVPVVTLDQFCGATGDEPDCVLVDVEGAELDVLEGARALLERRRSRLLLVVEMHPDTWTRPAGPVLAELGLVARGLCGQRDPLGEHGLVALEPALP